MGKKFMEQQKEVYQSFLEVGEELGMQKMWDCLQLALRDPETMGKDTIGRKRMEKIYAKAVELANYFSVAFTDDVEADHRQEELDRALLEIWSDDLTPFYGRYPQLKKQKYGKGKKGWTK